MDKLNKISIIGLLSIILLITGIYASGNVIDVSLSEKVLEKVTYNPLKPASGLWVDANENQSIYELQGTIFVKNNQPSEAVNDIYLNFTNIGSIYNITVKNGEAYVTTFNKTSNLLTIYIPEIGAGKNVTLNYNINRTKIAPPINFTTKYNDVKVFSGEKINITDLIENRLNKTLYPNNCVYNISVIENALSINQSGSLLNFIFIPSTLGGNDSSNVVFSTNNRTLTWKVKNNLCLNATNGTNIFYELLTPSGINTASNYKIINATISYKLNFPVSRILLTDIKASGNLIVNFKKFLNGTLQGNNATWKITPSVYSDSNITVNLTEATLWVSQRNATGTGFTNPSQIAKDTISGALLVKKYAINQLFNRTLSPWTTTDSWLFNYTYSSSPIVWMNLNNYIINDGIQLTNRSISYSNNSIYIKELYIVVGYWIEITKNITRIGNNTYSVFVKVTNLGNSPTPSSQILQAYNFLPYQFHLNGTFSFSNSNWYYTTVANQTLDDPKYNGTMYQFGIIPKNNPSNSSLDAWNGGETLNNTWTLTYNVTGNGKFKLEDLFLTGVDPLNVKGYGSTKSIVVESAYQFVKNKVEFLLTLSLIALTGIILIL